MTAIYQLGGGRSAPGTLQIEGVLLSAHVAGKGGTSQGASPVQAPKPNGPENSRTFPKSMSFPVSSH